MSRNFFYPNRQWACSPFLIKGALLWGKVKFDKIVWEGKFSTLVWVFTNKCTKDWLISSSLSKNYQNNFKRKEKRCSLIPNTFMLPLLMPTNFDCLFDLIFVCRMKFIKINNVSCVCFYILYKGKPKYSTFYLYNICGTCRNLKYIIIANVDICNNWYLCAHTKMVC